MSSTPNEYREKRGIVVELSATVDRLAKRQKDRNQGMRPHFETTEIRVSGTEPLREWADRPAHAPKRVRGRERCTERRNR